MSLFDGNTETPHKYIAETFEAVKNDAISNLKASGFAGTTPDESTIGWRPIQPDDFVSTDYAAGIAANDGEWLVPNGLLGTGYVKWIDKTIGNFDYFILTGISSFQRPPIQFTAFYYILNGRQTSPISLNPINTKAGKRAVWFKRPIALYPRQNFQFFLDSRAASASDINLALHGLRIGRISDILDRQ